jgi:signal transduction histidine kinase
VKIQESKDKIPEIENTRAKYIMIALYIFALCSVDYLPKFGIDVYPSGCLFFLTFASIITYAILKHNILDIQIVVRKGLIYSILITTITVLYFGLILLLEYLFRGFVGYKSVPLTLGTIAIFTVILQPLKNKIQFIADKYFFKGSIAQIEQENMLLKEELQQSEKLKAVATLAAGMAHEIKNPLTSIKIFTEYLPEKYTDQDFIEKFRKIVGGEVDKINNIVSQLLEFAKPKQLELKKCVIASILDETMELLSNDFIKHRVRIVKDYKTPSLVLTIDPIQIKQAMLNIILNSIDAMKNTEGQINIRIFTEELINSAVIEIEDNGCGIAGKNITRIFDPFFSTKDTSTGLGLSVVHGIIEKHNGKINISSESDSGTKVTIRLPLSL